MASDLTVKGIVPQYTSPPNTHILQMLIKYVSNQPNRLEVPVMPILGLINLLENLIELSKTCVPFIKNCDKGYG